jgi:hypothetical protein
MGRFRNAWRLLNLPCEGITRLASESLDRDLGRLERLALRSHLLLCAYCRHYARQITILRHALRRLAEPPECCEQLPGPGLPEDVRDRIKRTLKNS